MVPTAATRTAAAFATKRVATAGIASVQKATTVLKAAHNLTLAMNVPL
jgi:hypothetical protein